MRLSPSFKLDQYRLSKSTLVRFVPSKHSCASQMEQKLVRSDLLVSDARDRLQSHRTQARLSRAAKSDGPLRRFEKQLASLSNVSGGVSTEVYQIFLLDQHQPQFCPILSWTSQQQPGLQGMSK
jgi:hypothetical protein